MSQCQLLLQALVLASLLLPSSASFLKRTAAESENKRSIRRTGSTQQQNPWQEHEQQEQRQQAPNRRRLSAASSTRSSVVGSRRSEKTGPHTAASTKKARMIEPDADPATSEPRLLDSRERRNTNKRINKREGRVDAFNATSNNKTESQNVLQLQNQSMLDPSLVKTLHQSLGAKKKTIRVGKRFSETQALNKTRFWNATGASWNLTQALEIANSTFNTTSSIWNRAEVVNASMLESFNEITFRRNGMGNLSDDNSTTASDLHSSGHSKTSGLLADSNSTTKTTNSSRLVDLNDGRLFARWTSVKVPFWLSVHVPEYDGTRWSIFLSGSFYEGHLADAFYEILENSPPEAKLIDIGGNVGWFSLLTMATGHSVDVFEPNQLNLKRMKESIALNGWSFTEYHMEVVDKDTVKTIAVSEDDDSPLKPISHETKGIPHARLYLAGAQHTNEVMVFVDNFFNPGQSTLKTPTKERSVYDNITGVRLDTVAQEQGWYDSEIAIMKVDVEGKEFSVLNGAKELLASGKVQNLMMEFKAARPVHQKRIRPVFLDLLSYGYELHKWGGHTGPHDSTKFEGEGEEFVDNMITKCSKSSSEAQMNLWWKFVGKKEPTSTT